MRKSGKSHMIGANRVCASWRSWGGDRGGCAVYASVNLVIATATMALQRGGKLFSMCMTDSQLPFMIADVANARMGADAASASVTASHVNKPLP